MGWLVVAVDAREVALMPVPCATCDQRGRASRIEWVKVDHAWVAYDVVGGKVTDTLHACYRDRVRPRVTTEPTAGAA